VTIVRIDLRTPDGERATGTIEWRPTARYAIDNAVTLPTPVPVTLETDADTLATVDPSGDGWCWRVTERSAGGTQRYVIVPDLPEVHYRDLVDVDPDTLDPAAVPEAAWWAALAGATAASALVLAESDPIPEGTPTGTLIVRTPDV
jgi:hypothetical protein